MPRALWQKLGYTPATVAVLDDAPEHYLELVAPLPEGVTFTDDLDASPTFVHLFTTQRADLASALAVYADAIPQDDMIWVSWPKARRGWQPRCRAMRFGPRPIPFGWWT